MICRSCSLQVSSKTSLVECIIAACLGRRCFVDKAFNTTSILKLKAEYTSATLSKHSYTSIDSLYPLRLLQRVLSDKRWQVNYQQRRLITHNSSITTINNTSKQSSATVNKHNPKSDIDYDQVSTTIHSKLFNCSETARLVHQALVKGDVKTARSLINFRKQQDDWEQLERRRNRSGSQHYLESHYTTWSPLHRVLMQVLHTIKYSSSDNHRNATVIKSLVELFELEPSVLLFIPPNSFRALLYAASITVPDAGYRLATLILVESGALQSDPVPTSIPSRPPHNSRKQKNPHTNPCASTDYHNVQKSQQYQHNYNNKSFENVRGRLFLTTAILNGILATLLSFEDFELLSRLWQYIRTTVTRIDTLFTNYCDNYNRDPKLANTDIRLQQTLFQLDPDVISLNHLLQAALAQQDLEMAHTILTYFDMPSSSTTPFLDSLSPVPSWKLPETHSFHKNPTSLPLNTSQSTTKPTISWSHDYYGRPISLVTYGLAKRVRRIPNSITYSILIKLYLTLHHVNHALATFETAARTGNLSPHTVSMIFYMLARDECSDASLVQIWSWIKLAPEQALDTRSLSSIVNICAQRLNKHIHSPHLKSSHYHSPVTAIDNEDFTNNEIVSSNHTILTKQYASGNDPVGLQRIAREAIVLFQELTIKDGASDSGNRKGGLINIQQSNPTPSKRLSVPTIMEKLNVVEQCKVTLGRVSVSLFNEIPP